MLDRHVHPRIKPGLNRLVERLDKPTITADGLTLVGFAIGVLALPFLGICDANDPIYLRTRAACLSPENPYFYSGVYASGIGSPHTPNQYIWPISLCVQAMTSTDVKEITSLLQMLLTTTANTSFMHAKDF